MPPLRWFCTSVALLVLACGGGTPVTLSPSVPPVPNLLAELRLKDAPTAPPLRAIVRATDAETQVGLMYRKEPLKDDEGMLFIFPDDIDHRFWMENTYLSLDMVFIDSTGTVVGVLDHVPPLTRDSRHVGVPSRYVLEVGAGNAAKLGYRVGTPLAITLTAHEG